MEAGRELDAKTHELVFGQKTELRWCWRDIWESDSWSEVQTFWETESPEMLAESRKTGPTELEGEQPCYQNHNGYWRVIPNYSTDWSAAGLVAEHFAAMDWWVDVWHEYGRDWFCKISDERGERVGQSLESTAPHAICEAARKALEPEPQAA